MNQPTRERFAAGMAQLTGGVAALEELAVDQEADLLRSERQALQNAIGHLLEATGPIAAVRHQAEQRAPGRGKVAAAPEAPEEAAAAPAVAPPAPVAPVADRGVAAGLKAMALAIRDGAMAIRDHSDALRELAAARPAPPAAAAPAQPRNSPPVPYVRTGQVAEDLGVPVRVLQAQIRSHGGPAVGLRLGDWEVTSISVGPSGKKNMRWQRVEAQQQAA